MSLDLGHRVIRSLFLAPADTAREELVVGPVEGVTVCHSLTPCRASVKKRLDYPRCDQPCFEVDVKLPAIVERLAVAPVTHQGAGDPTRFSRVHTTAFAQGAP